MTTVTRFDELLPFYVNGTLSDADRRDLLAAFPQAEPRAVTQLPGFADGEVSVQDAAAQMAALRAAMGPRYDLEALWDNHLDMERLEEFDRPEWPRLHFVEQRIVGASASGGARSTKLT